MKPPASTPVATAIPLVALLLTTPACDSSSPTSTPAPTPNQSGIVFQDPSGLLSAHRATITALLQQTLAQAEPQISVTGVRMTVYPDAARAIPGWGIGGYAPSGYDIEFAIDPNVSGLDMLLAERLPQIAAHELHHAARWRGPGYGSTLLEAIVSEGLADHFALELLGGTPPPWTQAFPEDRTAFYWNRAAAELDSSLFDFEAWFFGIGTDLPRWTGYTLGYRLVRDYQDRNPGRSAADLVNTPADAFPARLG